MNVHGRITQPAANFPLATLQEFEKIVIGRREIAKWIESSDFRNGLKGAYVRVMYRGKYVIARIDDFTFGAETYKVELRDTQWQIQLSNGDAPKQFKFTLISDRPPTEEEFISLQNSQKLNLSQDYVKRKLKELTESQKFLYDAEEVQRRIKQQNY